MAFYFTKPEELTDAAREEAARRMKKLVLFYVRELWFRLGIPNPPPHLWSSKPGQYPRQRTGNLRKNIVASPTTIQKIMEEGLKTKAGLNPEAPYGLELEFQRQRLGFIRCAEEVTPVFKQILAGTW